ncbi:MAG TPA: STN domain-containing protein, partial [Puia sp.]|nr:STN domain-containing protein [Puia sp.]
MKLTCLLVAIGCTGLQLLMANTGKGQELKDVRVSMELRNQPLRAGFSMIEKQTDFRFAYSRQQIDNYKNISLPRGSYTVDKALELLLANTRLLYRQLNNKIIVYQPGDPASSLGDEATIMPEQPTEGTIKGKVTNEKD